MTDKNETLKILLAQQNGWGREHAALREKQIQEVLASILAEQSHHSDTEPRNNTDEQSTER